MTLFVRLIPSEKNNIKNAALSREVLQTLSQKGIFQVESSAVEMLLDHMLQHDDLWYVDAIEMHPAAHGAFFALKAAFLCEKLVTYSIPEANLEEEHLINALNKRGYAPWY